MSISSTDAGKLIIIYVGIPIFIIGVLGGLLNTIVFLSLRTFRQSSCAFYLTIMSIFNMGHLSTGLLSRIMITLLGVDGTETSLFYCKFRLYGFQLCALNSAACFILATFDQYCATCSNHRWRQFCNIKLARYLVVLNVIIWISHGIPYSIYLNHVQSPVTHTIRCTSTSLIFTQYRIYVVLPVLASFLPVSVTAVVGWMAYRNVQQLAYRTVPLVRRELEKQLTSMVLVQVVVNGITLLPYPIINAIVNSINLTTDLVIEEKLQFAVNVTLVIFCISFSSPFYIHIIVSERFRRQLIYVISQIRTNQREQPRMIINQVTPKI